MNNENSQQDDNGDVLRRIESHGDDLSRPRDIDFTVVFANELSAEAFATHFREEGYKVTVEHAKVKDTHPWDVRIVKHMVPSHAAITDFEEELQTFAEPFGGLNDGWGCLSQPHERLNYQQDAQHLAAEMWAAAQNCLLYFIDDRESDKMSSPAKYEREPYSAPGDFYIVKDECISCGVPHAVAPDLIGWVPDGRSACYWKKQPETEAELKQAFAIFDAQEAGCHRYPGHDPAILQRLSPNNCDYPLPQQRAATIARDICLLPLEAPSLLCRLWNKLHRDW